MLCTHTGWVQRRRTAVDELNMRSLYEENDIISVSFLCAASNMCKLMSSLVLLYVWEREFPGFLSPVEANVLAGL
jgi:hypothetical protein